MTETERTDLDVHRRDCSRHEVRLAALELSHEQVSRAVREHHALVMERLGEIQRDVHRTHEIVTGNGDPAKGLAFRLAQLEIAERGSAATRRDFLGPILAAALAIVGSLLVGRIESCERVHVDGAARARVP